MIIPRLPLSLSQYEPSQPIPHSWNHGLSKLPSLGCYYIKLGIELPSHAGRKRGSVNFGYLQPYHYLNLHKPWASGF
ncbi:hypothetical protein PanWU01x14_223570 [Parasponia andersonii]|uniref:Uncharacterized protein n=1 Tax=Parasponia andersonii TaxID=3476 RepID=A0A2P5BNK7_PARAD|nr:hypothetical protein PanWU01x14_223570 [Parasponia andersonii]